MGARVGRVHAPPGAQFSASRTLAHPRKAALTCATGSVAAAAMDVRIEGVDTGVSTRRQTDLARVGACPQIAEEPHVARLVASATVLAILVRVDAAARAGLSAFKTKASSGHTGGRGATTTQTRMTIAVSTEVVTTLAKITIPCGGRVGARRARSKCRRTDRAKEQRKQAWTKTFFHGAKKKPVRGN